jgi:hypothetical protein
LKTKKIVMMVVILFLLKGCSDSIFEDETNGEGFFEWDVENVEIGALNSSTQNQPFMDVNRYGGVEINISEDYFHSGNKSVKIGYPNDEAGVELKPPPFSESESLYIRKYEYYAPGWEGNWPVGLKTSRYFTTLDYSVGSSPEAYVYMSEKLIWQSYNSSCDEDFALGMNNAIFNRDLVKMYDGDEIFGNGLPYIRTGHWYKFETWIVLNSAVDMPDGVLQVWIDDVLVYSDSTVIWKSADRGCPNGEGWQSMWFGGNYSGAVCNDPDRTVYRYIDDFYLSYSLDR